MALAQSLRLALVSLLVCALLPPASPFVALQPFSCSAHNPASRRGGLAGSLVCRSAPKGYAVVTEGGGDTQNLMIGNREGHRTWARTSHLMWLAAAIQSTTTRRTHAEGNEDLELPVLLTWEHTCARGVGRPPFPEIAGAPHLQENAHPPRNP